MSNKRHREHFYPRTEDDRTVRGGSSNSQFSSRFPGGWNQFQQQNNEYSGIFNTDSSAATTLSTSTNYQKQHSTSLSIWEPTDCWKRIKYASKISSNSSISTFYYLNFPFELHEVDYLRRIVCILSEFISIKLENLLFRCCPWVYGAQGGMLLDDVGYNDFFLLLRVFVQELQTDYEQYSRRNELYDTLITFPSVNIDLLLQHCLYLYSQREYLIVSSRKLLSLSNPLQFTLPEIFSVAREIVHKF
jgi:hypothetical protein